MTEHRSSAVQTLKSAGSYEHIPSQHRHSTTSLRRSISGLCIGTAPELPDLGLDALDFKLVFGSVIGKGASGATVLRGSIVPFAIEAAREDVVEKGGVAKQVFARLGVREDGAIGIDDIARGLQLGLFSYAGEVPCAAKVLPLGAGTWPDMIEDFGREVQIMRDLKHPALVGFLGAGRIRSPLALETIPGPSRDTHAYALCVELCDLALDKVVQHRRQESTPFACDELGPMLSQVVAGLAYLHEHRILHRDIKSANVFLMYKGPADGELDMALLARPLTMFHAKLGDFGGCAAASRAQTPVQTPQWMAPEAMRMEGYGPPADVWGLGMLMYEVLELSIPYGEDITMQQLEDELTAGHPPRLTQEKITEERAPAIVDLMRRCLSAAPCERPTALELRALLAKAGWSFEEA